MDNFQAIDVEELQGSGADDLRVGRRAAGVVADVAEIYADGTGKALLTDQTFTWTVSEDSKIITAEFARLERGLPVVPRHRRARERHLLGSAHRRRRGADGRGRVDLRRSGERHRQLRRKTNSRTARFYQFGVGDEASGDPRLKGFSLRFDEGGVGAEE